MVRAHHDGSRSVMAMALPRPIARRSAAAHQPRLYCPEQCPLCWCRCQLVVSQMGIKLFVPASETQVLSLLYQQLKAWELDRGALRLKMPAAGRTKVQAVPLNTSTTQATCARSLSMRHKDKQG